MTAALSVVPDEPEQLLLRPVDAFARWFLPEPWVVVCARRRSPQRKPPGAKVVEEVAAAPGPWSYAGDLETWRAPARRGPARSPAVRPKRAMPVAPPAPARGPIRPAALRALAPDAEIALPRSRRRKRHAPRLTIAGDSHETLGNRRLTRAERAAFALDMEDLAGERFGPPRDDRDCPLGTADPCPRVGCRHHLYLEVDRDRTTLNWPGRHVDELEETCSVRAARAAAVKRQESGRPGDPAMSHAEVGRLLNLTAESVRGDLMRALAKLRAAGLKLGD